MQLSPGYFEVRTLLLVCGPLSCLLWQRGLPDSVCGTEDVTFSKFLWSSLQRDQCIWRDLFVLLSSRKAFTLHFSHFPLVHKHTVFTLPSILNLTGRKCYIRRNVWKRAPFWCQDEHDQQSKSIAKCRRTTSPSNANCQAFLLLCTSA